MKQTFKIPEGCTRVTIEQHDNQIITTFDPDIVFKDGDIIRWRAEKHQSYWFLLDTGFEPCEDLDAYSHIDNKRYEAGNYFQTEKQCNDFAERIKQLPR